MGRNTNKSAADINRDFERDWDKHKGDPDKEQSVSDKHFGDETQRERAERNLNR